MTVPTALVLYFGGVAVVAHFLAAPDYNWLVHSISEFAAQEAPNAWLMRLGFAGFGFGLFIDAVLVRAPRRTSLALHLVALYGACIGLSAVFSTAPISGPPPRPWEATVHSYVATVAGVSLSVAMLISALRAQTATGRAGHFAALMLTAALSALFGSAESGQAFLPRGIAQRALYLVGLVWLVAAQGTWRAVARPLHDESGRH